MESSELDASATLIANRIREILLKNGIGRRQHANTISRILNLSFSQAHRKLKGQSPWAIHQVNQITTEFGEDVGQLFGESSAVAVAAEGEPVTASLVVGHTRIPCSAHIGPALSADQRSELVALVESDGHWSIHTPDTAPDGQAYAVRLIKIVPTVEEIRRLSIAILDDSAEAADELSKYLRNQGFNTHAYYDIQSFNEAVRDQMFDGFVVDWIIGQDTSESCMTKIRQSENPDAPILVLTGQLNTTERESQIARAMRTFDILGPYEKPIRLSVIKAAFDRHFNR
ncbi:histidine kinase [Burkholderia vietnamiensis]|uniref:helix-turn-helix domain-containing protein n=1 Tax=Burkholderia vietnamiensis TaxID=60552 RepID=UPI00075D306E|nr:helix-turn-helix domain-containing protein [Burkholderia vietnamiensis]KVE22195.1 histidine kinase [Burkholderia vietnamiensis]